MNIRGGRSPFNFKNSTSFYGGVNVEKIYEWVSITSHITIYCFSGCVSLESPPDHIFLHGVGGGETDCHRIFSICLTWLKKWYIICVRFEQHYMTCNNGFHKHSRRGLHMIQGIIDVFERDSFMGLVFFINIQICIYLIFFFFFFFGGGGGGVCMSFCIFLKLSGNSPLGNISSVLHGLIGIFEGLIGSWMIICRDILEGPMCVLGWG